MTTAKKSAERNHEVMIDSTLATDFDAGLRLTRSHASSYNCGAWRARMRAFIAGFAVILTASVALAQQPPASGQAASRTMVSASEVTALIAKAKAERKDNQALLAQSMIQLAPYNVSLEYRAAVANAAVHETEAELFYVIDGSATLVTGGKLTNESRTNAANLSGNGIDGGVSRRVAKGDFIMVPEGTPHWFSAIDGTVVLMSLHLPHPPQR
jgi:mannose-6-phosphate isomerase-like protein (cupin superfamily)